MNFIDGNDSMIGQIMEKYPALGAVIQGLFDIFSYVFNAIGDLMTWLSDTRAYRLTVSVESLKRLSRYCSAH